jgi:hypothetical protein
MSPLTYGLFILALTVLFGARVKMRQQQKRQSEHRTRLLVKALHGGVRAGSTASPMNAQNLTRG